MCFSPEPQESIDRLHWGEQRGEQTTAPLHSCSQCQRHNGVMRVSYCRIPRLWKKNQVMVPVKLPLCSFVAGCWWTEKLLTDSVFFPSWPQHEDYRMFQIDMEYCSDMLTVEEYDRTWQKKNISLPWKRISNLWCWNFVMLVFSCSKKHFSYKTLQQ